MTYWSPSRAMRVWILVASDEATFGSVMRNADRIRPSSRGSHQVRVCSGVPYLRIVSILPVSGAEQLKTSGAQSTRPMISHSGAYSRLDSVPPCVFGCQKFHRPCGARLGLELLNDRHRFPASVAGNMSASMFRSTIVAEPAFLK